MSIYSFYDFYIKRSGRSVLDFTGFIPLTQYLTASERRIEKPLYKNQQITKKPIISAIELLGDLLSQVKGCEEYLLAYVGIPLSADTIFINEQK